MTYTQQQVYIFFRTYGFYPLYCEDNKDAIHQARNNPGTIKVEDVDGNILWEFKDEKLDKLNEI